MIDAIVLAAGFGRRMGQVKPLIPVDGRPALTLILERLREAGIARPIVVLGHEADRIAAAVDLALARVVRNSDPSRGLSSSLRLGLASVSPDAIGTLILHADMPTVTVETLRTVVRAAEQGASLAAPTYNDVRGFPVFLHRSHFAGLARSLGGDTGAKEYLRTHTDELVRINVDDPGCLLDFDRPEDLRRLTERGTSCATSV